MTRPMHVAISMAAVGGLALFAVLALPLLQPGSEAEIRTLYDEMSSLTAQLYAWYDPGQAAELQTEAEVTFARLLAYCRSPEHVATCMKVSREYEGRSGPPVVPMGQNVPHSFQKIGKPGG